MPLMSNHAFSVSLKKGEDMHTEIVSMESSSGTISDETFRKSIPTKYKKWEIIDITKQ